MEVLNQIISNLSLGIYARKCDTEKIISCDKIFAQIYDFNEKEEIMSMKSWDFMFNQDCIEQCKKS